MVEKYKTFSKFSPSVLIALLFFSLCLVQLVFAYTLVTIDGDLSDWQGKPSFIDTGGADDGKDRNDVNEYRLTSDGDNLYLLAAWDDTSFGNNQSSIGKLSYELDGAYYRVYFRVQGSQNGPQVNMQSIERCVDGATCNTTQALCNGGSCNVDIALSTSWADPFAGQHANHKACDGTNPDCMFFDSGIEMRIPWGQMNQLPKPANGKFAFVRFGTQDGKDNASDPSTGNGLACQNTNGVYSCYKSNPTAVELITFQAQADIEGWTTAGVLTGLLLLTALVGIVGLSQSH